MDDILKSSVDPEAAPLVPERKGARTHRHILDVALGLFLAQGYHAMGMRQVAQASSLTLGALYNHFPSKDVLFEEVFLANSPFALVPEALEGACGGSTEALLKDAARRLHASLQARSEVLRLVFIELLEFNGRHIPSILQRNGPVVLAFAARCEQAEGGLRPIPPYLLMRTFLGLLSAWFMADTLFSGKMPPQLAELQIEDAVDIFLRGALREEPSSETPIERD